MSNKATRKRIDKLMRALKPKAKLFIVDVDEDELESDAKIRFLANNPEINPGVPHMYVYLKTRWSDKETEAWHGKVEPKEPKSEGADVEGSGESMAEPAKEKARHIPQELTPYQAIQEEPTVDPYTEQPPKFATKFDRDLWFLDKPQKRHEPCILNLWDKEEKDAKLSPLDWMKH